MESTTKDMTDPEYRRKRRQHKHPFNFEVDDTRRNQLRQVAEHRGISMGAVLRQMITTAYAMEVQGRPHCVTGRECFMPHLHPSQRTFDTE
jgi:hypothetical protein